MLLPSSTHGLFLQQARAEIDALGLRSRFCQNFRTDAHSGLLNKTTGAILSTIYDCKYFTKTPGIIETSYLNKYLQDGQISREREVFGNRVHTTIPGVEHDVMRQTIRPSATWSQTVSYNKPPYLVPK